MPSDGGGVTGRCYCGETRFASVGPPALVSYCHCKDCRRVTGAPVAAFAAFKSEAIRFLSDHRQAVSVAPGVTRRFCRLCGSPLDATYDYLPGMTYLPVGLIDQDELCRPQLHSHADRCLSWLHIDDALPRQSGSARDELNALSEGPE